VSNRALRLWTPPKGRDVGRVPGEPRDPEMHAYCRGVWERWPAAEVETGTWEMYRDDRMEG
jgi:hypothetical protein